MTQNVYRPGDNYYKEMVRKSGKVLCCMFLMAFLRIDLAQTCKIQNVDIYVLTQLTKKRHCDTHNL